MTFKPPRTNLTLLRHRMTEEQRRGFALALKYGARGTAIAVRANKVSLGAAIVSACREIGTSSVVKALTEIKNPEWSFVAIRYAPGITKTERRSLVPTLDESQFTHARWVLENMLHLSKEERATLAWLLRQT